MPEIDCVVIEGGQAREIIAGVAKAELRPAHPDWLAKVVEVPAGSVQEGAVWNGEGFDPLPVPEPVTVMLYGVFRARWQPAEKAALFALEQTSWAVRDLIALATAQNSVNVASDEAAAARTAFVAAGVLSEQRAAEIFAPL